MADISMNSEASGATLIQHEKAQQKSAATAATGCALYSGAPVLAMLAGHRIQLERWHPELGKQVSCGGEFVSRKKVVGCTIGQSGWSDAGIGDRHGDIARTGWTLRSAAVLLSGETERLASPVLDPGLSGEYLSSYRRELPVDPARLRLWLPLQFLNAWAMAVAGEQGFFGPSHAGFDARIATWAEEQFWLSIEDLP
jgi:hypothetical protein